MMVTQDSGMFLKSSFNSVEKDLAYITQKISENESLLKLLVLKENETGHLSAQEKKEIFMTKTAITQGLVISRATLRQKECIRWLLWLAFKMKKESF